MTRIERVRLWIDHNLLDIILALFLVAMLMWAGIQEAYGSGNCTEFRQGFKDGYCAAELYGCFPPVPPMCFESQYTSSRQAYMDGYDKGRGAR